MISSDDVCRICGRISFGRCKCPRGDRTCPNGHSWHFCTVHGRFVDGPSDHSTDTFSCSCKLPIIQK